MEYVVNSVYNVFSPPLFVHIVKVTLGQASAVDNAVKLIMIPSQDCVRTSDQKSTALSLHYCAHP